MRAHENINFGDTISSGLAKPHQEHTDGEMTS